MKLARIGALPARFVAVSGFVALIGCGNQQEPSFQEKRENVAISLTIAEGADSEDAESMVTIDESTAHIETLEESDIEAIWGEFLDEDFASDSSESSKSESEDAVADVTKTGSGDGEELLGDQTDAVANSSDGAGGESVLSDAQGANGSEHLGASEGSAASANHSAQEEPDAGENAVGTASADSNSDSTSASTGDASGSEDFEDGLAKPSRGELAACAKLNGVSKERVKVVGNQSSATITANSVLAIKVAGNRSDLSLSLGGSGEIAAICLFVAGNQSRATIDVDVAMGNLIYVGRGNQSRGDVSVGQDGSLSNIVANLSGNQAALNVGGTGSYSCAKAVVKGNRSSMTCQ